MRKNQQKNSILIVRLSPASEIIMASPIVEAIKKLNPNTEIVWVCQPEFAALLTCNPLVDKVITWDKKSWKKLLANFDLVGLLQKIRELRAQLKSYHFEIAIDLQGLFKSGLITWLSGAPLRIGLGSKEGSNWLMTRTVSRSFTNLELMGAQYKYLAEQLGYKPADWKIQIKLNEDLTISTKEKLEKLIGSDPYAVICPFSSQPQYQWSNEHWQQLALRLRGRYHLRTIILANKKAAKEAEDLSRRCGAINFTGEADFINSAAIIQNANLMIGVDNDYTHLAHAFNTPAIGLFGATCPYLYAGNDTSKIIYLDRFCSPCRKNPTCNKKYQCMMEITPDMVLAEIKTLLRSIHR